MFKDESTITNFDKLLGTVQNLWGTRTGLKTVELRAFSTFKKGGLIDPLAVKRWGQKLF